MAETLSKTAEEIAAPAPAVAAVALPYAGPSTPPPVSDWSPLRNPIFRSLWIASAVSYIGYEIRNYAAPLLMGDFQTKFGVSNGMKAYTFTASTLPIPCLVLFAGALADRVDRRKLLIITHLWMMLAAGLLGILTIAHITTPWMMLGLLFVIGAGYAMANPAFLAVLPELVEPRELRSALALNSVNMNIARVLGPAIGGLIIVTIVGKDHYYLGKGSAFLATALSLIGVVWVLARWKPAERKVATHPESIWAAVGSGIQYTWFSPRLLVILARIFLFMFFAGILPTFCANICKAKENIVVLRGETGAAIMMAFFGIGAIIGVYLMQATQRRFGVEVIVTLCILLYGLAMLGVSRTPNISFGCAAMFIAGFSWVIVPTNFNIATQLAVPGWIKGRAMGMYVLVLWGSMSAGSAVFGRISTVVGDRWSLFAAGIGVIVGSVAIFWLRLVPKTSEDFVPAQRSSPEEFEGDGPVLVSVDYQIDPTREGEFRQVMKHLRDQRRRNGAARWHLTDKLGGAFTESYVFWSWRDRVRHAARTTRADVAQEEQAVALHIAAEPPAVHHAPYIPPPGTTPSEILADGAAHCFDRLTSEVDRLFDRMAFARQRDTLHRRLDPKGEAESTMLIALPVIRETKVKGTPLRWNGQGDRPNL